ncbi:unnamed protein product, partial [Pylaiella littoralis]
DDEQNFDPPPLHRSAAYHSRYRHAFFGERSISEDVAELRFMPGDVMLYTQHVGEKSRYVLLLYFSRGDCTFFWWALVTRPGSKKGLSRTTEHRAGLVGHLVRFSLSNVRVRAIM